MKLMHGAPTTRPPLMASEYAISAGHYLAAEAGKAVLDSGGNAFDAGVAAGIAMSVVQSDLVNFAGVAPIMAWHAATQRLINIDGLGTWPAATDITRLAADGDGAIPEGVLRTIVPAAPAAWLHVLEHLGSWTFADVAAPAIRLARDGFAIDAFMCDFIASHEAGFGRWPGNASIYLPKARPPLPGERFVQEDLARTLTYMADEERAAGGTGRNARQIGVRAARDAFYKGDIAQAIVEHQRREGGWLDAADMANHEARLEPIVSVNFRGHTVHTCGPWSQGPALAQTLGLLDRMGLERTGHNEAATLHTIIECLKLAFADREAHFIDPAFGDVPLTALLDESYLASRCAMVDPDRAWPALPPAGQFGSTQRAPSLDAVGTSHADGSSDAGGAADAGTEVRRTPGDTSYVCVVDRHGNALSATPSDTACESPVVPGTGLCPSSRGSQSRSDPRHPACAAPGKRPRLTPNPAMAFVDGKPSLVFGTPGGDVQVQAMAQFLINKLVFGMDVQAAIEAPRVATFSFASSFSPFEAHPGLVGAEARIDPTTLDALEARGHRIERWTPWTRQAGAMCAIEVVRAQGALHAGADPRRAAYALGR